MWILVLTTGYASNSSIALSSPAVPDALKVSPKETLLFAAKAQGVQIYQWLPKKDSPTQYEWVFKAPEADPTAIRLLFNPREDFQSMFHGQLEVEQDKGRKRVGRSIIKGTNSAKVVDCLLPMARVI